MNANNKTISMPRDIPFPMTINRVDNEYTLSGASREIINIDNNSISISKSKGWENVFTSNLDFSGGFHYLDSNGSSKYILVAYPRLYVADPESGSLQILRDSSNNIYTGWVSTGKPNFVKAGRTVIAVDGINTPLVIEDDVVSEITFPPTYSASNSSKVTETRLAFSSDPATVSNPYLVSYHKNRVIFFVENPQNYVFFSQLFAGTGVPNFSTNTATDFNIAFFNEMPTNERITAALNLSDEALIIYLEDSIYILTGSNPQITGASDIFDINLLRSDLGCLSSNLVVSAEDIGHYFVGSDNKIYKLLLSNNFRDSRPMPLTRKINPIFRDLKPSTLARGFLIKNELEDQIIFLYPDSDHRRYPNKGLTYNYSNTEILKEYIWKRIDYFEGFVTRDVFIDRRKNKIILLSDNGVYKYGSGVSLGGYSNRSVMEIVWGDLGLPNNYKRINNIKLRCSSSTGTSIKVSHSWEDTSISGTKILEIPTSSRAIYGSSTYSGDGDSERYYYSSKASFYTSDIEYQPINREGKVLKLRIEHESSTEDFQIDEILVDFTLLEYRIR